MDLPRENDPRKPFNDAGCLNGLMAVVMGFVLLPVSCCLGTQLLPAPLDLARLALSVVPAIALIAGHLWACDRLLKLDRVPVAALIVGIVLTALDLVLFIGGLVVIRVSRSDTGTPAADEALILLAFIAPCAASLYLQIRAFMQRHDLDATHAPRGFSIRPAPPPPPPPPPDPRA